MIIIIFYATVRAIQRAEGACLEAGGCPQPAGREASLGGESRLGKDSLWRAQKEGSWGTFYDTVLFVALIYLNQ